MAYILVIDDDPAIRGIIRRILENAAHEVEEAGNGKEGLRRLRDRPADLVIADVYMDEMDGVEFLIETRRARLESPVLMMSGGGRVVADPLLDVADVLGAVSTIAKPFDEERLLAEVVRALATDGQTAT